MFFMLMKGLKHVELIGTIRAAPEWNGLVWEFYVFVGLEELPESISDGMAFFRAALEHNVICVPGVLCVQHVTLLSVARSRGRAPGQTHDGCA